MALIVDLRPLEQIFIGMSVVTNADHRTRLEISGSGPVLREKDVLQEQQADTPCKKAYFLVQYMYLAPDPKIYFDKYLGLIQEIQTAVPSTAPFFFEISKLLQAGSYFPAVKEARKLLKHEAELLKNV